MGCQGGTDRMVRRRVCLTRRSTSSPIIVVQPEMRSSQRTTRRLAFQNLIELSFRTIEQLRRSPAGNQENEFCQRRVFPDACHPKGSPLWYQNEPGCSIGHGDMQKSA